MFVSASEIFQHMANYTRPALQKQVVRVLLMVPVYALASFFSLAFPRAGPYLDVVRELYEALTIYAFTWFVLAYLELDANLSFASFGELLASRPPLPHMWPLTRILQPWPMGTPFIRAVQVRDAPSHACVTRRGADAQPHPLRCSDGRPQLCRRAPHHRGAGLCADAVWPVHGRQRGSTQRARATHDIALSHCSRPLF